MAVQDFIIQITNEAILITIVVSMPAILLSLVIGVAVAIFSATTQIQEQTLSFVPKIAATSYFRLYCLDPNGCNPID